MEQTTSTHVEPALRRLAWFEIHDGRQYWPLYGAIIGLAGGAFAPLLGLLFTLAAWLIGADRPAPLLHRLGAILLLATVPLLLFGGYSLDKFEARGGRVGN